MTPERWLEVKQIFNSAIRLEPSERRAFLSQACGEDASLRKEVEALIESSEKAGSFIDTPAFAQSSLFNRSELRAGDTLGSYQITSAIGRGGMGEVYLANDNRLNRRVALKVLPAAVMKEPERMRRFEQEARAASALNHPNIITIYEISQANGTLMIATEFVEGITLRQRLTAGPLELREALHIAIQIADALAAAHRVGIIHRDIKPENIMIRPDGYVKVLDFGLAKLAEPALVQAAPEAPTQLKTGSGVVMGTIGYMSPEQARGQAVDARSDIFNLGTVIYEMVAGHGPFAGDTPSDVFAAILKSEPQTLSAVVATTPPELDAVVEKALQKDRDKRFQDINELLSSLRTLKEDLDFHAKLDRSVPPGENNLTRGASTLTQPARLTQPSLTSVDWLRKNRVARAAALLVVVVAMAGVFYLLRSRRAPAVDDQVVAPRQLVQATQVTSWAGFDCYPALSPDGNSLSYSSDRSGKFEIYVKQLTAGGREVQLTSDGLENFEPAWSPDGKWIAYTSKNRGGIWIVPSLGGSAKQLTESGSYPSWSADGSQIAFQSAGLGDDLGAVASGALLPSTIRTVPSKGGEIKQITQVGHPAGGHGSPAWSPDGERIVFGCYDPERTDVWTVSVKGGEPTKIARGYDPIFAPDGKTLYFASFGKNLNFGISKIAVSETGKPEGEPIEIVGSALGRYKRLTLSTDGKKLAFGTVEINSNIWNVALSAKTIEASAPALPLTRDSSFRNSSPMISPDGKRVAYHVTRVGTQPDVYVMNSDGSNQTQLTTNPESDQRPSWFPDGEELAFLSRREGHDEMWAMSLRSGRERKLFDLAQDITFPQLSPDGTQVSFNSKKSGTTNVWVIPVAGGEPKQLTFDQEAMGFPCWSPDSKYIAFEVKRGDDNFLALIPATGGAVEQLNFDRGQSWPYSFSPDGDKIAFAGFRAGYWNVWWYSRSTKEKKQVTNYKKLNAFVRYPSWSKDNHIVYEYAETTGNIWMIDVK
jgi:Tol biopolymer transport system component/serine/threonine protein kinase